MDYLYKYGLHDCILDDLSFENGKFIFSFESGVYKLNSIGKETSLTNACKMVLDVGAVKMSTISEYIVLHRIDNNYIYEVEYDEFITKLVLHKMDVEQNYCSGFCNTVLLEGYVNDKKYKIIVSEIKEIDFIFD